eukprot:1155966-Pelagomonas_calceolata.AAC.3
MIGIKKVTGGGLRDSFLVDGVAFKKTFSYAGFEQQPKSFVNPKILLLNIELELKAEKENAESLLLGSKCSDGSFGSQAYSAPQNYCFKPHFRCHLHELPTNALPRFCASSLSPRAAQKGPYTSHTHTAHVVSNSNGCMQVRLDDPSMYQSIVDAEWNIIYDKLDK